MAFPPQFLDDVRARVGLSELIGRKVALRRAGRELIGLCPFHGEKTPSFTVSEDKGFFHCFGCGAHGDVIGFAMRSDGLSFLEAVETLAAEAGLQVPRATPEEIESGRRRAGLRDATEAACAFYEEALRSPAGRDARAYLAARGVSDETAARFRLGFAPPTGGLRAALMSAEMPEAVLIEAGLLRRAGDGGAYDFFRGRVMFPIADPRGRVVAFGARAMGDARPKYLNSPETPLFDKQRTLYGLAQARAAAREAGRVVAVEGYMDVIALSQAGLAETVAPLGTALGDRHVETLWRLAPEPVLCFDGDEAGRRAAGRAAERALPLLRQGLSLRFAALPSGEDPDSLVRARGLRAVEEVLGRAVPLSEAVWEMETEGRELGTPERLAGLDRRLEDRARAIADGQTRFQYLALFRRRVRELSGRGAGRPAAAPMGGDVAALRRRHDQVLLAAAINHPALLDEHAEALAAVELSDRRLDSLLGDVLEICALRDSLDSDGLKTQIRERGNAELLDAVLGRDVLVHAGFARGDAGEEESRSGFLEVLSRYLERDRLASLEAARHDFADDPTDENWRRIRQLKTDAQAGRGAALGTDGR